MTFEVSVENIKCGGCANSIVKGLQELEGIASVAVDVEQGRVTIDADDSLRTAATERLLKLGYPEQGSAVGLKAAKAKAKSFVSCAVGRITDS
jgi:copper chaperone